MCRVSQRAEQPTGRLAGLLSGVCVSAQEGKKTVLQLTAAEQSGVYFGGRFSISLAKYRKSSTSIHPRIHPPLNIDSLINSIANLQKDTKLAMYECELYKLTKGSRLQAQKEEDELCCLSKNPSIHPNSPGFPGSGCSGSRISVIFPKSIPQNKQHCPAPPGETWVIPEPCQVLVSLPDLGPDRRVSRRHA